MRFFSSIKIYCISYTKACWLSGKISATRITGEIKSMAGTYPDAPGPRIPYDRDGTQAHIFTPSNGTSALQSQAVLNDLNDEDAGSSIGYLSSSKYLVLIFPQLMDISHYAISWRAEQNGGLQQSGGVQYSTNTTNFIDGTWTSITNPPTTAEPVELRTKITTANLTGVRAMRFLGTGAVWFSRPTVIHLYGKPSVINDRLEFWHPTLDQPLSQTPAYFDYGDVSRGTGAIQKDFRIKNLSTTLTASGITIGVEAFTDGSPTYVSQTQFSYNSGSFGATASLAALGPNSISQPFTVKLDTTMTSPLGVWSQRYYAQAGGWA
jgi:hypothetical protein